MNLQNVNKIDLHFNHIRIILQENFSERRFFYNIFKIYSNFMKLDYIIKIFKPKFFVSLTDKRILKMNKFYILISISLFLAVVVTQTITNVTANETDVTI